VDVWRAVPTVNNVKLTGPDALNPWARDPNPSGGYQLDASFGSLQEQALGALHAHAEIQIAPPQRFLDDLSTFQSVLFSSRGVRELSEAINAGVSPPPDPDPPLNELEQAGKVVFTRACGQCHGGPGQSTPQLYPGGVGPLQCLSRGGLIERSARRGRGARLRSGQRKSCWRRRTGVQVQRVRSRPHPRTASVGELAFRSA
jgi:hypothetical protein